MKSLALPILLSLPLIAQSPIIGLQGGADLPKGDLKKIQDSKQGYFFGGHVLWDLQEGKALRGRVEYGQFQKAKFGEPIGSSTKNAILSHDRYWSNLEIGSDFIYYPSKIVNGLYFGVGVQYHRWQGHYNDQIGEYSNVNGVEIIKIQSTSETISSNNVGESAIGGYQFNKNIGLEFRYSFSKINQDLSYSMNMLSASITWNF